MSSQNSQISPFPSTDAEIRARVLEVYKETGGCCVEAPIKSMLITAITPIPTLRYILESLIETREIGSNSVPYRDDGFQVVPTEPKLCPEKWSVVVEPSASPGSKVMEFKDTSSITICLICKGAARLLCENCLATGLVWFVMLKLL
jgi:hypothetical protein